MPWKSLRVTDEIYDRGAAIAILADQLPELHHRGETIGAPGVLRLAMAIGMKKLETRVLWQQFTLCISAHDQENDAARCYLLEAIQQRLAAIPTLGELKSSRSGRVDGHLFIAFTTSSPDPAMALTSVRGKLVDIKGVIVVQIMGS